MNCPPKSGKENKAPWRSVAMVLSEHNSNEVSMGRKKLIIETICKHTHFT